MNRLTRPPTYTLPPVHLCIHPPPPNLSTASPRTLRRHDSNSRNNGRGASTLSTDRCVFFLFGSTNEKRIKVRFRGDFWIHRHHRVFKWEQLFSLRVRFSFLLGSCDSPSCMISRVSQEHLFHLLPACCVLVVDSYLKFNLVFTFSAMCKSVWMENMR